MTNHVVRLAACALLPAALFAFTSCSSMKGTEETAVFETPDGAMIVNTITVTATVTAIDAANRKVTFTQTDKKSYTYKAGPNLDLSKLRVGDQVNATLTEEAAVFLRKPGTPPSAGEGAAVALARQGATKGEFMADTAEVTATIITLNAKERKVALRFADGSTKTFPVGKNVNFAALKSGDVVTVQVAQSLAIAVTKP